MPVIIDTLLRDAEGFRRIADVASYGGDPEHVEGAIVMRIDGSEILSVAEWDDVNWLWPFLVRAAEAWRSTGAGASFFPDQPIRFGLQTLPTGRVLVSLDLGDERRAAAADAAEFLRALAAAGRDFFRHLERLSGRSVSHPEGELLRRWLADC